MMDEVKAEGVDVFVQSGWQHSVQSRLPSSTLPPDFLVLSLNTSTMARLPGPGHQQSPSP